MKKNLLFAAIIFLAGFLSAFTIDKVLAQTGTIYACVTKATGILRIVDENTTCKSNEDPLSWNKEGPAGPPGSQDQHTKTLTNNTDNDLFSLPLADGESASIYFSLHGVAKKGSDWATGYNSGVVMVYNDEGTLHKKINSDLGDSDSNGGSVSLNSSFAAFPLDASINTGIVTVTINPGNVGTDPDSIVLDYAVINPSGKPLTFLP